MKKSKKILESTNPDDQFEDFNQDDFADLDQTIATENAGQPVEEIDDLTTEYHGADPDLSMHDQDQIAQTNSKRNLLEMAKDNWLYLGIGAVVIVVAAYLLMDVFSSPTPAQQPAAQQQVNSGFNSVPAAPAAAPTTQVTDTTATPSTDNGASAPTQTTAAVPAPAIADIVTSQKAGNITMTDEQMQELMQGFTDVIDENAANIEKALAPTNDMKDQIGNVSNNMNTLSGNVNQLSDSVNKLTQNLASVQQQLVNTQGQLQIVLSQETATSERLTLRAVVPGRAWLVNGNGQTTTVIVGTSLGAIGTVTNIDPAANTVTTSTGYIFK